MSDGEQRPATDTPGVGADQSMEIVLPSGCGNAPRMLVVAEFVTNWARGDTDAMAEWLADDATWSIIGEQTHTGVGSSQHTGPRVTAQRLEVLSIVTHGRLASCDGYLEAGATRISFSHVFRFTGVAKSAKIAELRTYRIEA